MLGRSAIQCRGRSKTSMARRPFQVSANSTEAKAGVGSVMELSGWIFHQPTHHCDLVTNFPRLLLASLESGCLWRGLGWARPLAGVFWVRLLSRCSWDWLGVAQERCGHRSSPPLVLAIFRWEAQAPPPASLSARPAVSAFRLAGNELHAASTGDRPTFPRSWNAPLLRLGAKHSVVTTGPKTAQRVP